jgi:hypothetical protein
MRQQEIFKKIGVILSELIEQYDYLQEEDNHLNSLELELLLANSNFLTNHVEILYKLNLQNAKLLLAKNDYENEQKFFEPLVQHVIYEEEEISEPLEGELPIAENKTVESEELIEPANDVLNEPIEVKEPEGKSEQNTEEIIKNEEIFDEVQPIVEHDITEHTSDWNPATPSENVVDDEHDKNEQENGFLDHYLNDNKYFNLTNEVENEPLTVNQKISSQLPDHFNDQTIGLPLKELKHGITLNDKLLYVKDLFNGYNLAYSEAIEILNRFSNFEEASKFLNTNYVTKNNWMSKSDTVEKFYSVLKRRYL